MTFSIKNWQNNLSGGTKLDSNSLKDLETRLSDYTDDQVATIPIGPAGPQGNTGPQGYSIRGQNHPTGTIGASIFDRALVTTANMTTPPISGRLHCVRIPVQEGDVITNVNLLTGVTQGTSLTNCWVALYAESNLGKLVVSADNQTATWAADTVRTLVLAAPYTIPNGVNAIYAGFCIVGTNMPSLAGFQSQTTGVASLVPYASFLSNTGLTDPASAPATATQTASNKIPYVWLT